MCTVLHFGFSICGLLVWMQCEATCWTLLRSQYKAALAFHHMCVVTNFSLFAFYMLHEVYIGRHVGADLTLMPRTTCEPEKTNHEYVPAMGGPFVPPGHMPVAH